MNIHPANLPTSLSSSEGGRLASVRILVVDDDVTILGLIEEILGQEEDIILTATHDSEHALGLIRNNEFDLLITDLKMPKVDGLTLVQELHKIREETLVIVITGFATMETCLEALKYGAYDFLTKPFRMSELLHVVRKAVEQVRILDHVQQVETLLSEAREQIQTYEQHQQQMEAEIHRLEEENQALLHLTQRAGLVGTLGAKGKANPLASYPLLTEKPKDRLWREMERLNQLEEQGAVSPEEAERARQKMRQATE